MVIFELKTFQEDVRKGLKDRLTKEEDPAYQHTFDYEEVRKKAKELVNNDAIKRFVCAKSFRTIYECGDYLSEAVFAIDLPGFDLGQPYADLVHIIIAMALVIWKTIGLSAYCS